MSEFKIGDKIIGLGHPTYVVAEIGVNHDGDLNRALELVRIAVDCGADAIKLQLFSAERLMHQSTSFASYQKDRCADADAISMLRRYELSREEFQNISVYAQDFGVVMIATPFSPDDVAIVEELRLPAVKIASPDVVNQPLLARAVKARKPLLISTGAATLDEIEMGASWLRQWHAQFALLHCVSSYPTPSDQANLSWIGELANRFGVIVGYSDHTTDPMSGALAVAAGAAIVEKHLTYNCSAEGPDHSASADPDTFFDYVRLIRRADVLRGMPGKRVLEIEKDVRTVSRQSLVLCREMKSGELVRDGDLTVQRPGTGIPAAMIDATVGKRAARALPKGTLLQWDMLQDAA